MADVPRDKNGRLLAGAALGGGGRRSHPDWFTDRGVNALVMLNAAATGEVVDFPDMDPAVRAAAVDLAADIKPGQRIEAARRMAEAIYGKSRDIPAGPQVVKSVTFMIIDATAKQEIEVRGELATGPKKP